MTETITIVGLDVHKRTIAVTVANGGLRGEVRYYSEKKRLGSLTMAGNSEGRCVMVEAAWTYRLRARGSATFLRRQIRLPKGIRLQMGNLTLAEDFGIVRKSQMYYFVLFCIIRLAAEREHS